MRGSLSTLLEMSLKEVGVGNLLAEKQVMKYVRFMWVKA
ncbi:hypothetical protein HMPREF1563_1161 [Providencia alcalifaciens 205/92]|uniref:Uncharacterized protein n=1 Tax=Providencia alcalifaciens 205/92 TaxID=1256988 RepID=A0AAV3M8U9_9GAMM|nr:hypothetical protein HMPREF1563_1161 [Providencia alcalifaciens 205/92]